MNNSGPPPTKRMRYSGEDLKKISKDDLIDLYVKQQDLLDGNQRKSRDTAKDGGDKTKNSLSETSRRENLLMMRLATKEQEMQQYAAQITHIKKAQEDAAAKSLREVMLDPAINLLFNKMKDELKETKDKLEQAQSELSAWKFTPDSQTGKKLMSRCRTLIAENQELGKQLSQGKVAQLEAELALQKKYSEELKESQEELNEFVIQLDEEVEGMQSTIQLLQQQLTDSRKELEKYKKMTENIDFSENERTKDKNVDIRTKNQMEVTTSQKEIGDQDSKYVKAKVGVNGIYENQIGVDSPAVSFENSEFVCKEECESDGDNEGGEENPMEIDKYQSGGEGKEGENTPTYSEHEVIDESQDSTPLHTPERALSNNGEVGENQMPSSIESLGNDGSPANDEMYAVIDNGSDDETEHIAQISSTNDATDERVNDISYEDNKAIRTPISDDENHDILNSEGSAIIEDVNAEQHEPDSVSDIIENTIPEEEDAISAAERIQDATNSDPLTEPTAKVNNSTTEKPQTTVSNADVILVENDNVQKPSTNQVQQLVPRSVPRTEVVTPTNGPQTMLPPLAHSLMPHAHVPLMGDSTSPYLMNPHFQQLPNAALAQQQAFLAEQQALMYKTMLAQHQQQLTMADEKNNSMPDSANTPRTGEELRTMNPLMHGLPYADPAAAFMAQYKAMLAAQQMFVPGSDGKTPQMLTPGGLGLYPGLPLVQPPVVPQPTTDPVTNGVTTSWPSCTNVTYAPHPLMAQGFLGANPAGMMLYPGHNLTSHAVTATPAVVETDTKQQHIGSGDHGPIQNGLTSQKNTDAPDTNPKEDTTQAVA
ncbi:uncharacterized protein LOC120337830 [Styela clava]